MRPDFCAFILTHGRADRVITFNTLGRCGYTGPVFIVVDNEDKTVDKYRERFGDKVIVFDKLGVANTIDEGDNFGDRRAIIYARNVCFDLAKERGFKYFIELDDDYTLFRYRWDGAKKYLMRTLSIKDLDAIWSSMVDYFESIDALTIAMAQGGDFMGGNPFGFSVRKTMNSFICSTERPFTFHGRINEDVNTYVLGGSRGDLFLAVRMVDLKQKQTQSNAGGMTDLYLDAGTYIKSFYTVMSSPSSVCVRVKFHNTNPRLHHSINWSKAVAQIIPEELRKT